MAPTGRGGNVTISEGSVNNLEGGLLHAGSGGTFAISGGTVVNDLTSTLGTSTENLVFTGGTLITTGDVVAFTYTQGPAATLQLNLTSLPSIVGNVAASGTASVDGTLIVNALPGLTSEPDAVTNLITGEKGVIGTYPIVNFTNFPATVIPSINYTPTAVQIALSQTVTPTPIGSVPFLGLGTIVEINSRIERNQFFLHRRLFRKKKREEKKKKEEQEETSHLYGALIASNDPVAQLSTPNVQRKQDQLARRLAGEQGEAIPPTRFYFGPIDSFGSFKTITNSQLGFNYNSYGFFTGIDHVFDHWGAGMAIDYRAISADVKRDAGNFTIHQAHGTAYAVWVPPALPELALDGLIGFTYDSYKICRKAGPSAEPVEAKGRPDGIATDALVGVEYIFSNRQFEAIPKYFTVSPFFNTQFIWLKIDEFRERNAGIYDLKNRRTAYPLAQIIAWAQA